MDRMYEKVVRAMSRLEKYYYRFVIYTMEETNEGLQEQEYYGDYKVDFVNKIAYISINSDDDMFLNQELYYADNKVYFKEEEQEWDILELTEDDYDALFAENGSLFDFDSYNTRRMDTYCDDGKIIFSDIYLPDYDFDTMEYIPDAYKIKMKANKRSYLIDTITFTGDYGDDDSGRIKYKYTKVAVNDRVDIPDI